MRKSVLLTMGVMVPLSALIALGVSRAADDEGKAKPKYSVKQVMEHAHKDKLMNKVRDGEASAEEKLKLLDLYVSLTESKPPKGDLASWTEKTNAAVVAAAKAVTAREDAAASLTKAINCADCHKAHRE